MRRRFSVGESVKMTGDAVDNYGEKWRDRELIVESVATKYMPAAKFFAEGKPTGYHPGFDASSGCALYDLVDKVTANHLPMSLYDWELTQ